MPWVCVKARHPGRMYYRNIHDNLYRKQVGERGLGKKKYYVDGMHRFCIKIFCVLAGELLFIYVVSSPKFHVILFHYIILQYWLQNYMTLSFIS